MAPWQAAFGMSPAAFRNKFLPLQMSASDLRTFRAAVTTIGWSHNDAALRDAVSRLRPLADHSVIVLKDEVAGNGPVRHVNTLYRHRAAIVTADIPALGTLDTRIKVRIAAT